MTNFIIIGNGSHARVVNNVLLKNGLSPLGLYGIEDDVELRRMVQRTLKSAFDGLYHVAIGDNLVRQQIEKELSLPASSYFNVISASSILDSDSLVGIGTFVGPLVYVGLNVIIGKHSIVNSGAKIDHDSVIGNFTHVGGNSYLAGNVRVGDRSFIGAGVTVIDGVEIASDVVVGAGATVVSSILDAGTYVGTPAKRIK
jgi:acetyltransferase EpsM